MKKDIATDLYKFYKSSSIFKFKKQKTSKINENPGNSDDPQLLKNVLNDLIESRSWQQPIAERSLFTQWGEIVGLEVSSHSEPITFYDGKLTVRASSTAWATQLTLLIPELLQKIKTTAPGVLVEELVIVGPQSPSWKRGIRSIKGARGPRDTYG